MSQRQATYEELHTRNVLLREEVYASRRASEITATLVVDQFVQIEEILKQLEETIAKEKKMSRYLAALHETALGLIGRLELSGLLQGIVSQAGKLMDTPHGFIYLTDAEEQYLRCAVGIGSFRHAIGCQVEKGESLPGAVWERGKPLLINDPESCSGRLMIDKGAAYRSIMGVPLQFNDHVLGVIGLAHSLDTNRVFSDEAIQILSRFAELAAIALDNALLYASATKAKEAAEKADRYKSDFLANMSHEIRTPLNAILGMTHLARQQTLTPKLEDYLEIIYSSAQTLCSLINDILDFSKIEAGKLHIEKVDFQLRAVLDHLADIFFEKAAEKGNEMIISIAEDVPCALVGDPLRIGQVLINLTANAVKFTSGGEILIRVGCLEKSEWHASLNFSIADTGIGIAENKLHKLFAPFAQADTSTTRKYGGTGLGLAISRRLIEQMGGTIAVESVLGKGSTFTFSLRLDRQHSSKEEQLFLPEAIHGLKALVVDDNHSSRIIMGEMLESFNFKVQLASSGKEAFAVLEEHASLNEPIDLLLIDWKMPDWDGIQTSAEIKKRAQLASTKIILMTAFGGENEIRDARALGVEAFLFKPIKQSLLFDSIMEVFGYKKVVKLKRLRFTDVFEALDKESLKGARVLLVEDNLINQQVASEMLGNAGLIVEVASNGKEAIAALARSDFDVLLMDIQMPEMDGLEATRIIRSDPKFKELPIIAMTAHSMKGDQQMCLDAGMNDYVSKPVNTRQLFSALAKWAAPQERTATISTDLKQNVPVEQDVSFPDTLPGFDLQTGLQRLSNNKGLYKLILEEFAENHAGIADEISKALKNADFKRAAELTHGLKGMAGNLSAIELYNTVLPLDQAIRQKQAAAIEPSLQRVTDALAQAIQAVQNMAEPWAVRAREEAPLGEPEELDVSIIAPLLQELSVLLQNSDLEAGDRIMRIKDHLAHSKVRQEIYTLEDQLSRFDFSNALSTLGKIAQLLKVSLDSQVLIEGVEQDAQTKNPDHR